MTPASWYRIRAGSILAASFLADELPLDLTDPKQMMGQMVELEGVLYKVIGVETVTSNYDPNIRHKHAFGLAVKPV
jgi:hypothetical protein